MPGRGKHKRGQGGRRGQKSEGGKQAAQETKRRRKVATTMGGREMGEGRRRRWAATWGMRSNG